MNTLDKYIRMANQIAKNFAALGEAEAVSQTATHIEKFWDPRMRSAIDGHVAKGGEGLSAIALDALKTLAVTS